MATNSNSRILSVSQTDELLLILQKRFEKNKNRHQGFAWKDLIMKLNELAEQIKNQKFWALYQMEITGGEPDVVDFDKKSNEFIIMDCSLESPKVRRSLCYDREGLESRKDYPPKNSAMDMAQEMGIELLSEADYRFLQNIGEFDLKTSSWIQTPDPIRKLGGALFGDCRYNAVFIYHNGAQSYYAARGFRGKLRI
jgi:hypothetical protein